MSLMAPPVEAGEEMRWRLMCLHRSVKRRRPTYCRKTSRVVLSVLPSSMLVWPLMVAMTWWAVEVGVGSMFGIELPPGWEDGGGGAGLKSVGCWVVAQMYSTSSMSTSMPLFRPAATRSSSICSKRFFSLTAWLRKSSRSVSFVATISCE